MKFKKIALAILFILVVSCILFLYSLRIAPPEQDLTVINPALKRIHTSDGYQYGPNWLKKERPGLWYMYAEGEGFERGYAIGLLTKELAQQQEVYFVNEINKKVPAGIYQFFLKVFVGWFNRKIDQHIPLEYQKEIYGVSLSASEKYSYIAPAYQRMLNYHAAHDIGHALQNMHLVACTALGAWDQYAEDSTMYIGRNFDFYVGDDFAREKIIAFINPKQGYQFMSVTWGGMCGVLSGMNMQGLTVTLNADKSGMPSQTGTPVSIIGREILQYASTIDEAYAIAKKHTCFVSESFMIGSAKDRKIAVIEKTPQTTALYYPNDTRIVCANHYQSKELKNTPLNVEDMNDSTSVYRHQRVEELLQAVPKMNEKKMAALLRDQRGLQGKSIGWGNPKAVNQLIAHHSIIFNPYKKLVWISTSPYQLGDYVAIHLEGVFKPNSGLDASGRHTVESITDKSLVIAADSFLFSPSYRNFVFYRNTAAEIQANLTNKDWELPPAKVDKLIAANPDYYYAYQLVGDYFQKKKKYAESSQYYRQALGKEMPSVTDRQSIQAKITANQEKIEKGK
ncbi:MAG: C45 family peptidase [Bacteroidota bacterium]